MADIQRRPDPVKYEGLLLRLFPREVLEEIVYFEQAVLADSTTLNSVGYETFVVTRNALYHVDLHKQPEDAELTGLPFAEIEAISLMEDLASFFPENIAMYTTHIRVSTNPNSSVARMLDFYTFYEDSQLYYNLQQALSFYKLRTAFPVLYNVPNPNSPFSQVTASPVIQNLTEVSIKQYLDAGSGFYPASIVNTEASSKAHIEEVQEVVSNGPSPTVQYTVSSTPGVDAITSDVHVMDQDPALVEARVEYLLTKMRALEQACVLAGGPKGLVAQKRMLNDSMFMRQLMEDFAVFGTHIQHYLAAQTYEITGNSFLHTRKKALGMNEGFDEFLSPRIPTHGLSDVALSIHTHRDQESNRENPDKQNSGQIAVNSGLRTVGDQGLLSSFESVEQVFHCRDGHAVEELARIDMLNTLLTLLWMLLTGNQVLGHQRFEYFISGGDAHLREVLHATLLADVLLLQPQGLAYVQLDISRRRRYAIARAAYEEQRLLLRLKEGESSRVVEHDRAMHADMARDVLQKLKQRLSELDRHYAALLHTIFDLHQHAHTLTGNKALSPEFLKSYVLGIPRFLTERVPCLLYRAGVILKDPIQTPTTGFFLFSILSVLYITLSKSEEARETVATQCQELLQYDIAPKDNLQRCVDSSVFFYRESAGVLRKLVKMLGSEATSNAHLFGWTG